MIAQFAFTIGSEEEVVRMCLGSGRVHTAWRHGVGQCVEGAIGVGRQGKTCLSLLKGKEMGKMDISVGPLGRKPATYCRECAAHDMSATSRASSRSAWSRGWESSDS